MKIIKKNQLTILVLALMLVTAGYLNYNSNQTVTTEGKIASIGDATLVSSNIVETNNSSNNVNSNIIENKTENSNSTSVENIDKVNTVNTNSEIKNNENYYSASRLERDTMYSQMLESYQKILDSTTTSSKQKEEAQK